MALCDLLWSCMALDVFYGIFAFNFGLLFVINAGPCHGLFWAKYLSIGLVSFFLAVIDPSVFDFV